MNNVSIRFLVGFVAVTSAGVSLAQAPLDGLAGMSKSAVSANAIGAGAQSTARLNAPSPGLGLFANAVTSKPSTSASLQGGNAAVGGTMASVTLGAAAGKPASGDDVIVFSKPIASAGMANALSAGTQGEEGADTKAQTLLGVPSTNAPNPAGEQRINASQRLGR